MDLMQTPDADAIYDQHKSVTTSIPDREVLCLFKLDSTSRYHLYHDAARTVHQHICEELWPGCI